MTYTVWQRAGVMLVNIDHDAELKAQMFYDAGFRTVFPQTHVGTTDRHSPSDVNRYLESYRKRGFLIGHWGSLFGPDARAEAVVAANWDDKIKSDFYVPNPELAYKYTGGDGLQQCPACFTRSSEFVSTYRKRRPYKPVGVSSYARFDQADIHWATWLNDANARALPQAYVNEIGYEATPEKAFLGAIDVKQPWNPMYHPKSGAVIQGFPLSYVHVTIAKPDPQDTYPLVIEDWIDMLVKAKAAGHTLGFTIYEGENFTEEDIKKLGQAIKTYSLAGI